MKFEITVAKTEEAIKKLRTVETEIDNVSATLYDELEAIANWLTGEVQRRTPSSGASTLRDSIQPVMTRGVSIQALISTPLVYGVPIEFGRKPGSKPPPYKALLPWVKRKFGVDDEEAVGIAIATAKNIGKWGFLTLKYQDKQQMFQDAWDENLSELHQKLEDIGIHVSEDLLKSV